MGVRKTMRKEPVYDYPHLWPVGPGGLVATERVVAVGRWDSAPIRRAVRKARADGRLIDLTYGHACQWVLYLDSGHLVLATEPVPVATAPSGFDPSSLNQARWEEG
jgi:regulator of extracellular matrix RemA (YlzA/DUF370 family)